MLKIDLHTHSLISGHSLNTVYELAREAKEKSIRILGITEHGPSMEGAPHEGYFWISDQIKEINGVKILLGIEANILDETGRLDLNEDLLKKQSLVIAGLHSKTPYKSFSNDHTKSLVNAMKNKYVKIISHPFRPEYKIDIEKVVKVASSEGVLLELNDQLFKLHRNNSIFLETYKKLISLCRKHNCQIIIGSDAHFAARIGQDENVLKVKDIIGLTDDMIINYRETDLINFLKR